MKLSDLFRSTKGATSVEQKSVTLTDPAAFEIFGSIPSISGRSITAENAMKVPAFRAGVNVIAEMCGVIPFKIFEADAEGGKSTARDHPSYFLLHDEPNDTQGAEELRADLTRDALLHDSGYAFVNRVGGRVQEIIRLEPTRVTAKQIALGTYEFHYQDGNGKRVFTQDEILRLPAPGGSPIKHGREAIALALELEACAARIFSKGGRPSGVLTFPNKLGDTGIQNMREGWNAAHSGENSGKTAVLEDGGQFNPFTFSSVDSEFTAMRMYQVVEMARLLNVPPTLLFDLTNGTYSNTEQLSLAFKTYTLGPWLTAWARAYGRAFLAPEERGRLFIEPVYDALNATDTAARADAFGKLIAARVMTPNEARAAINLPAHPDGDTLANPYTTTTATGPATPANDDKPDEAAA